MSIINLTEDSLLESDESLNLSNSDVFQTALMNWHFTASTASSTTIPETPEPFRHLLSMSKTSTALRNQIQSYPAVKAEAVPEIRVVPPSEDRKRKRALPAGLDFRGQTPVRHMSCLGCPNESAEDVDDSTLKDVRELERSFQQQIKSPGMIGKLRAQRSPTALMKSPVKRLSGKGLSPNPRSKTITRKSASSAAATITLGKVEAFLSDRENVKKIPITRRYTPLVLMGETRKSVAVTPMRKSPNGIVARNLNVTRFNARQSTSAPTTPQPREKKANLEGSTIEIRGVRLNRRFELLMKYQAQKN